MSMPTTCINVDINYFTHPKTLRLIGLLGKGSEVLPIRLWCWCAKYHAESGLLAGYSTEEVESCVSWWGESGRFVEAMLKVGFVEQNEIGFYVHDFTHLNGHIAAFKERARVGAEARWKKFREEKARLSSASSTAKPMLEQCSNELTNYQTTTSTARAVDDDSGETDKTAESPPTERATAVSAAPGNDLEQILYDRIGWKKRLSRFDMDRILRLKASHPPDRFFAALDKLHGGVSNVPSFLEAVLAKQLEEQKSKDMKSCRKCGHEWNPWTSGKSLCPVCYPDGSASPAPGVAKITPLVNDLSAKMEMRT